MKYKIIVDKSRKNDPTNRANCKTEYIITEEFDYIKIETNSPTSINLKDFLLDLDECDTPYILMIEGEENGNNI